MTTLRLGNKGVLVKQLQDKLNQLGFEAGMADGDFGPKTFSAVKAFQLENKLEADGVVGRRTHAELALELSALSDAGTAELNLALPESLLACPPSLVYRICHDSSSANIYEHWPLIYQSLEKFELTYKQMLLMAIATVYVETGRFSPLDEYKSKYNTSPNGHPFDKYDDRVGLGNTGKPDGARYKGRGYIQLTGRSNYRNIGRQIGISDALEKDPELANDPRIAAEILACFLKNKENLINDALSANDLAKARKAVNGGNHGLTDFKRIYKLGDGLIN